VAVGDVAQHDLSGRVVVVTGANSGIGKETAAALAARGAHVVMSARNREKGEAAAAEVRARTSGSVELVDLDLASFASVRRCATELLERHDRLHVLVNNAGLVLTRRTETEDGCETTFQVNHLGHFLLTTLLLDRLRESAPARVVHVASHAHRYARAGLDFSDLHSTRSYRGFTVYARTKLANILFARELAKRLAGSGVTSNAVHPGFVASGFARDGDASRLGDMGMVLARPFALSPRRGARTSVHVASAPELATVSGQYFVRCRARRPSAHALDDGAAIRLWEASAALVAPRAR
jgi:NAD(P)-dependent dehydrogenase (short-subunit alcohol dehydrogenase family)